MNQLEVLIKEKYPQESYEAVSLLVELAAVLDNLYISDNDLMLKMAITNSHVMQSFLLTRNSLIPDIAWANFSLFESVEFKEKKKLLFSDKESVKIDVATQLIMIFENTLKQNLADRDDDIRLLIILVTLKITKICID